MSALTFKAVIGSVHFDPKKGIVKIQLEATSHVSLDELTSLGPHDESIRVRFESEQTRIGPITIDEEGVKRLKEAARLLRDNADIDKGEEPEKKENGLEHCETPDPEGTSAEE